MFLQLDGDTVLARATAQEITLAVRDKNMDPLEAYRQFVRELAEWAWKNFKQDAAAQMLFYVFAVTSFLREMEVPPEEKEKPGMWEEALPIAVFDRILVEEATAVDKRFGAQMKGLLRQRAKEAQRTREGFRQAIASAQGKPPSEVTDEEISRFAEHYMEYATDALRGMIRARE